MIRFKYLYPIFFILFITLPIATFFLIDDNESESTFVAISGVASFLFGLLATFTLNGRHDRLEKIVHNGSIERGEIVFMYEALDVFGPQHKFKVIEKIDLYLMATLDLEPKYFYRSDKEFKDLLDAVIALPIRTDKQKMLYERLIESCEQIEITRKYSATLFEDRITMPEWIILYFLIGLIYISLLFSNTGALFSLSIIMVLASVISYLLLITIKADRLKWKVDEKIFEPYQQTFEAIGLKRYYPKVVFERGKIKRLLKRPAGTEYRLGTTPDYPDLTGREVETRAL